jgi:hypothetical protein
MEDSTPQTPKFNGIGCCNSVRLGTTRKLARKGGTFPVSRCAIAIPAGRPHAGGSDPGRGVRETNQGAGIAGGMAACQFRARERIAITTTGDPQHGKERQHKGVNFICFHIESHRSLFYRAKSRLRGISFASFVGVIPIISLRRTGEVSRPGDARHSLRGFTNQRLQNNLRLQLGNEVADLTAFVTCPASARLIRVFGSVDHSGADRTWDRAGAARG